MKKNYTLSAAVLKALHASGSDDVKAALEEIEPSLAVSYPAFVIGKKSGCLYLLKDAGTKIRLTDGAVWSKFRDGIGDVSEGTIDLDDYYLADISYEEAEQFEQLNLAHYAWVTDNIMCYLKYLNKGEWYVLVLQRKSIIKDGWVSCMLKMYTG